MLYNINTSRPFQPEATNSLVVIFDSFSDEACNALHSRLQECGLLWHFVKLKSFGRCLAVFADTADAQKARYTLNSADVLPGNKMRMYYSMHTPLSQTQDNFLSVPAQEKIWLISPPGSPAINWRQTREDPPNATHLERRLEEALQELSIGQFSLNPEDVADYDSAESDSDNTPTKGGPDTFNRRYTVSAHSVDDANSSTSEDGQTVARDNEDLAKDREQRFSGAKGMRTLTTPMILIQNYDDHPANACHQASSDSLANRPPTPSTFPRHIQTTARPPL
ncbi:hypothetical protein LPJ59_001382 [Coemansia sp. RSA 2399]|nr:hypothetical protein LPJ59_001382 [Coemansia sp. RSA 2399]KAJ1906653.1 hypothetical protein LPJ81_001235 [Coemansia sp. IMI 209127]